jgi:hypothetical protein
LGDLGCCCGPVVAVLQSFLVVTVDTSFDPHAGTAAMRLSPITMCLSTIITTQARVLGIAALAVAGISLTGCQVDVGGQTLPSAYYLQDDIQYFPAGPEFKLSKEAAALKAYKKELAEVK